MSRFSLVRFFLCMAAVGSPLVNAAFAGQARAPIYIGIDPTASPRIEYGAARLAAAIGGAVVRRDSPAPHILVGTAAHAGIQALIASGGLDLRGAPPGPEGFLIAPLSGGRIVVLGGDDSGALYGCLELARRVRAAGGALPTDLRFADAPALKLRGPCIGMQKTSILPGRHVYEYPYTTELFPFFYDRAFWTQYLDFLAENRMNSLYLWNGHPFASLVKLPDYPYALEVSEEQLQKNVEMFRFIAREADRRGIWVVQMFYNIILSKPFAEHHGLETQLKAPVPLAADYTRKSIAEFVRQYPNVGLMVCLGEALQGLENQVQWCTEVILPGVKDGMQAAGLAVEPPVVIRTHATDLTVVMPAALKIYRNLYTEAKYNGESLTTWEPRGVWQQTHLAMSRLGSTHLANIHILANLEPFRYGAQRFIRQSVLAARDRLGARGIHLYPLAYWNWPDSPDQTAEPLRQIDRDWIWFEAWARYAWNPDVDEAADRAYWIERLASRFGTPEAAANLLDAYNDAGECAPRILRRFGITEGNRQTLSLGMTLDQLVDPEKYSPYPELWLSQAPPGERLQEYADREWAHEAHTGETPPQIVREVLEYSQRAVAAARAAAPLVTRNREEFARLRNDIDCIRAMSQNYAAKANAALRVLRYRHSHDVADMAQAARFLAESLDHYRELVRLTDGTYRFANSMQTRQRRIPVPGGIDGELANYHWRQLLPLYEKELADFQAEVTRLQTGQGGALENAAGLGLRAAARPFTTTPEHPVTEAELQRVFEEVKTPYKFGVVLHSAGADELFDCPSVFRHGGQWYMLYVSIGNKTGYETHLAQSADLLHWTPLGTILPFADSGWDQWQGDGGAALVDPTWGGSGELQAHDGRYWMSYIGGAKQGYEPDPLAIGLAWTKTPDLPVAWNRLTENPVLSTTQPDVRPFENITLYKSTIFRDATLSLGYPFVMFYNGKTAAKNHESIGMAVSEDLTHWIRYGDAPVVDNAPGRPAISGDPQIVKIGDMWVMFYFGFRWQPKAFDTFACSRDLVHWTKWTGPALVAPSEPWDRTFAHKPWVLKHDGVVYHFYCAVGDEGRVIALATSKDLRAVPAAP